MTEDPFQGKYRIVECINEDVLVAFASGALAGDAREGVERHFDMCVRCMRLLGAAASALSVSGWNPPPSSNRVGRGAAKADRVGDFQLVRPLGRGGMGIVFEALNRATGERVALKTVRTGVAGASDCIRREIHALRRIRHPGVVEIDSDGWCDGVPFYTMELIKGPILAEAIATLTPGCPPTHILTVLRKVCSTLAFLHGEGIVHRDLTPRNIMLRHPRMPVLVDFGLASHFAGAVDRDTLKTSGRAVGTLAYMAPEQVRGELVDARADLYSLGCILYEVSVGAPPFRAATAAEMIQCHLNDEPPPPSTLVENVPPELERLTLQLLTKTPSRRLVQAGEVATVLAELGAEDWDETVSGVMRSYAPRYDLAALR